uniref:IFI30 lysosomal thiol reductase b n=1 Tax=Poecilia formosa TaxID=48698 RepID=A0A096LWL4_POEFO
MRACVQTADASSPSSCFPPGQCCRTSCPSLWFLMGTPRYKSDEGNGLLGPCLKHLDCFNEIFLQEVLSVNSPFSCQHGEPECRGNMIQVWGKKKLLHLTGLTFMHRLPSSVSLLQACIIHLTGTSLAFQVIYCMESAANVLDAAEPCLQLYAPSVSWVTVDACATGRLGYKLMHGYAVMTRALNPAHTHVPWVTIDGEYTEETEAKATSSLFRLVCDRYKGVKPPVCTGAPVKLSRSGCLAE